MQLALRGMVLAVLALFTACLSLTRLHVHRRCITVNATDLIFHMVTCQYSTVLQYFMMQQCGMLYILYICDEDSGSSQKRL